MSSYPARVPVSLHSPWLAVAGVIGVYFSFGFALGVMAPMVDEITADLGLSRSTMGSILGAWALIYIFTAVPAGAVVDRLGLPRSLTLGGLSITLSLLLRSVASGAPTLFLAVAVFGIGGPLVSIATPKLVASLFSADERRLPTGLAVAAPTLGSATALASTNPLLLPLTGDSWRSVMVIAAAIALVATVAWRFASRAVSHVPIEATQSDRATLVRLLRLPSMQRILAICLLSFFISHALTSWLPEILVDAGRSEDAAGYLAAISVLCGIAGSLAISRLVPTRHRRRALGTIFMVMAATLVGLTTLPVTALVLALGLLGFSRAGIIPLLFLEIMGDPDISFNDIGAATGLFFAVGEIGGFTGPYMVGFLADRSNGFDTAVMVLTFLAIVAAGLASLRWRTPASRRQTP